MRVNVAWTSILLLGALTAARSEAAGPCDPPNTVTTFDPRTTTGVVDGQSLSPVIIFSSPENPDPSLVYHVGSPGGNGCVAGIHPGSPVSSGTLQLTLGLLFCVQFDVHSTVPYMVEQFDASGLMVGGGVTSAPTFGWLFVAPPTLQASRIVLTPGTLQNGEPDALCVDNIGIIYGETPALPRTWGTLKTIYR